MVNKVNYDQIIDQLSEDQDFLGLSQEEQDSLIDEIAQEQFGKVPNSESILQRATSGFRKVADPLSAVAEGFSDTQFPFVRKGVDYVTDKLLNVSEEEKNKARELGLRDVGKEHPVAYGIGASLPVAHAGVQLSKLGGKGINWLFGTKSAERKLRDVALEGASQASKRVGDISDEMTQAFGEGLDKLPPSVSGSMLSKAVQLTADEMGISTIKSHPLMNEIKRLKSLKDVPMASREVQSQIKNVLSKVNDKAVKSSLYKNLTESLPQSLKDLKSSYAPMFNISEQGKKLTSSALMRAGKGSLGDLELSALKEAEDTIGIDVLKKAIKAGSAINRTKTAKSIAKIGGATGIAGLILDKISGK